MKSVENCVIRFLFSLLLLMLSTTEIAYMPTKMETFGLQLAWD